MFIKYSTLIALLYVFSSIIIYSEANSRDYRFTSLGFKIEKSISKGDLEEANKLINNYIQLIRKKYSPENLSNQKAIKNLSLLIKILDHNDQNARSLAANALGYIKDERAVLPLIHKLKDKVADVRRAAARALGAIQDTQAVLPLIEVLKDQDNWTRRGGVIALGEIKDPRAVPYLIKALKDEWPAVRAHAARILKKFDDPNAKEALKAYLISQKKSK